MQHPTPPIQPIIENPVGELLLETVIHSEYVVPELQEAIASYVKYQSAPRMSIAKALFGKDMGE